MKKLIIIVCCLWTIIGHSQTKEETIDWINKTFWENKDDHGIVGLKTLDEGQSEHPHVLAIHMGSWAYSYNFSSSQVYGVKTYRAPYGNYNVKLFFTHPIISKILERNNSGEFLPTETNYVNEVNLVLQCDKETSDRLERALVRYFNITGGNLSSEELFKN